MIASGEPFIRTVYSVAPNFAVPDGRIRFCMLIALTTSAGDEAARLQRLRVEVHRDQRGSCRRRETARPRRGS